MAYLPLRRKNVDLAAEEAVYRLDGSTKDMSDSTIFGTHKMDVEFVEKFLESMPKSIEWRPIAQVPSKVKEIEEGPVVRSKKFTVRTAPVEHINSMGFPCFGYRVDSDYGSVAISGDTQPCASILFSFIPQNRSRVIKVRRST